MQEIRTQMPQVDLTLGLTEELTRDLKDMNGCTAKGIHVVSNTNAARTAGNRQLVTLEEIGPDAAFLQAQGGTKVLAS